MTSLASLSRRVFVLGGATMSAAASFAAPPQKPLADKPDPLAELDAVGTAERIQKGEISAFEAVYAAVLRATALQPKLNFLSHPAYDHGLALAKTATGPLGGVPTLIKDLTDWAGEPTGYGARFSRLLPPSASSAPVVASYLAAGACPIGKSQTPEFGLMPTTEPKAFGPVHNPWDLTRSAGGSSGGSAAAVAARVVPIAHGNDGGGSLRIPASLCGLVGLKPSRGRMIGDAAGDEDFIVNFGLSRSVRDAAALFAALEKPDGPYKRLGRVTAPTTDGFRIGYVLCDASGHPADPEVQNAVLSAAVEMMHLGHKVEEVKWPYDGGAFTDAFAKFWQVAAAGYVDDAAKRLGRAPTSDDLESLTLDLARHGRAVSVDALDHARHVFARSVRGYLGWFAHYDVVISPVVARPAPPLGWIGPDQLSFLTAWRLSSYAAYTPMANVSGAPALSLPLAQTASGLPIGVQFMAGLGEDETLLKLALQIEAHKPWSARTPPILTA